MNRAKQWWLSLCLVLLAIFGGTLVPVAAIACKTTCVSPLPHSFYDGRGQPTIRYDNNAKFRFAYDTRTLLATDETKIDVNESREFFVKLAEFLAAKNAPVIVGENMKAQGRVGFRMRDVFQVARTGV